MGASRRAQAPIRSRTPAAGVHRGDTGRDDESNQRQQDCVRLTEGQPPPLSPRCILTGLRDGSAVAFEPGPAAFHPRGADPTGRRPRVRFVSWLGALKVAP